MSSKTVIMLVLVTLFLVVPVFSYYIYVPGSNKLTVQDCKFLLDTGAWYTAPPAICGSVLTYRCLVENKYVSPGNLTVAYTFKRTGDGRETSVTAVKTGMEGSQSIYTGSIQVEPLLSYNGSDSFTVTSITVLDQSNSASCTQTNLLPNPYQVTGCYMARDSTAGYERSTACTCGTLTQQGTCNVTDVMAVTFSSNSELCSGLSGPQVIDCSYCDPQWIGWYQQGCGLQKLSGYMWGVGDLEYFHGSGETPNGQFCCGLTNSSTSYRGLTHFNHNNNQASDCIAPAISNAANQSCEMDAWLGKGKSPDSYGLTIKNNMDIDKGAPSFFMLNTVSTGTDKIQPLVADIEGDGQTEVFAYQGSAVYSYIVKKDINSPDTNKYGYVTLKNSKSFSDITFFGQPAIVDLSYTYQRPEENVPAGKMGVYKCSMDDTFPSCGSLRIAIFGTNQTSLQRTLYILNGSNLDIIYSYVPMVAPGLEATQYAEVAQDTGIACVLGDTLLHGTTPICYFSAYLSKSFWGIEYGGIYIIWIDMDGYDVTYEKMVADPRF